MGKSPQCLITEYSSTAFYRLRLGDFPRPHFLVFSAHIANMPTDVEDPQRVEKRRIEPMEIVALLLAIALGTLKLVLAFKGQVILPGVLDWVVSVPLEILCVE